MLPYGYYEVTGAPLSKSMREKVASFLRMLKLEYDAATEFTAVVLDADDRIAATGSLQGNVLKCIGVDPECQGTGLTAVILTALLDESRRRSQRSVFLYTKPQNHIHFEEYGFSQIAQSNLAILMERPRNGLSDYLRGLPRVHRTKNVGAIVANCNPITNGHLYLMETAKKLCDFLYIFVLSEDRSIIPAQDRLRMVLEAVGDWSNVFVCETSQYLISSATFPTYFIKDSSQIQQTWCELDIDLFGRHIAPALGISQRFVGTEPLCAVTRSYNHALKERLPAYGIQVNELLRISCGQQVISASLVRKLVEEGDFEGLRSLVPLAVYRYLIQNRKLFSMKR